MEVLPEDKPQWLKLLC